MICPQCVRAADNEQPGDHCSTENCSCAHWPVGHCQVVIVDPILIVDVEEEVIEDE